MRRVLERPPEISLLVFVIPLWLLCDARIIRRPLSVHIMDTAYSFGSAMLKAVEMMAVLPLYTCENIRLNIALHFRSVYCREYSAERRRYTPECRRGGGLEGEADESVEEAHGLWEYVLFRL